MNRDRVFWLAAAVFAVGLGAGLVWLAAVAVGVMSVCWLRERADTNRLAAGERIRRELVNHQ